MTPTKSLKDMYLVVVAQRQTERQAARERDRGAERVLGLEEHHGHQVATLETKLKSMEKDRNLLMVRFRKISDIYIYLTIYIFYLQHYTSFY